MAGYCAEGQQGGQQGGQPEESANARSLNHTQRITGRKAGRGCQVSRPAERGV
jgi:hypothetical protein